MIILQEYKICEAHVALDLNENSTELHNAKFTLRELRDALSNTESSSLGEDSTV